LDLLNTYRSYLQVTIALSLIHTLRSSLQHALSVLSLLYVHRLSPGNGFQRRSILSFRVQVPLLTGDCLTTNSVHQLTPRLAAISHQSPTLLTAFSRLSPNSSCSSLYSLGTDRTQNAASNTSIVDCACCRPLPSNGFV
jgi:hypothetical protein